jgi:hypothetical protein
MNGLDFLNRLAGKTDTIVAKAAADQEAREGTRCRSAHVFADLLDAAVEGGEKGVRVEARLTLKDIVGPFAGEYGDRWLYKFHEEDTCNLLVWWSSSKPPVEKGATDLLKFTVVKHEEYQGVKQTVIQRVKTVKAEVEAAKKRRTKNREEGRNDDGTDGE